MTEQNTAFPSASILGYPRIGRRRELKKAVEAYWAGKIDAAALDAGAPGLHIYTFNEHQSALEVLDKLSLARPARSSRHLNALARRQLAS